MKASRFRVTGKVQGVFFRASTRNEAVRLRLRGYAKNLADGSVEVLVVGELAAIDELHAWLQLGPPLARVAEVERADLEHALSDEGFFVL